MPEREELYRRYAALRDEKGLTDYRVSKATQIDRGFFAHFKRGDYTPKVDKMLKLADFFGVGLDYFYRV